MEKIQKDLRILSKKPDQLEVFKNKYTKLTKKTIELLGEKTVLNEFYAYFTMNKLQAAGTLTDDRTRIIMTYALCGFSNIVSIGIQIGGIGALAPEKRGELAKLGWRALLGGSLACFLTACVAAMLT